MNTAIFLPSLHYNDLDTITWMHMILGTPRVTDERLRSWLDGNQLDRERMCQALLNLDQRFRDVRPLHPRGGPDEHCKNLSLSRKA